MDHEKQFELVFKVLNWFQLVSIRFNWFQLVPIVSNFFQLVSIGFNWFWLVSIEIGVPGNLGAEHFVRGGHHPLGKDGRW